MPHIKEVLLRQIQEYDQRAAECCAKIVKARLNNKPESDADRARMTTAVTSSPRPAGAEALRHFVLSVGC